VKTFQSSADTHPFRCRADRDREIALDHHYRNLGNNDVIAALASHRGGDSAAPAPKAIRPVDHDC